MRNTNLQSFDWKPPLGGLSQPWRTSSACQLVAPGTLWNMNPVRSEEQVKKWTWKHSGGSGSENIFSHRVYLAMIFKNFFFHIRPPQCLSVFQQAATLAKKHKNKLFAIPAVPMGTGPPRVRPAPTLNCTNDMLGFWGGVLSPPPFFLLSETRRAGRERHGLFRGEPEPSLSVSD